MLLQEAVSQDGHRGEADVVHRQIGCIIQGLGRAGVKGKIMVRRRRGHYHKQDKTRTTPHLHIHNKSWLIYD